MPHSVFICYRREDTAPYAGWLRESLVDEIGPDGVFMDIDNISPGADFDEVIQHTLDRADTMLVLIGPRWISAADAHGTRRLDDPEDYVRREVASGLERSKRVIPVLVGGARLPNSDQLPEDLKLLVRRQAIELSDIRWKYDTSQLLQALQEGSGGAAAAESQDRNPFGALIGADGPNPAWSARTVFLGALFAEIAITQTPFLYFNFSSLTILGAIPGYLFAALLQAGVAIAAFRFLPPAARAVTIAAVMMGWSILLSSAAPLAGGMPVSASGVLGVGIAYLSLYVVVPWVLQRFAPTLLTLVAAALLARFPAAIVSSLLGQATLTTPWAFANLLAPTVFGVVLASGARLPVRAASA